jgi:hypothetical protein
MPRRKYDLSSIDTFLETGAIPEPNTGCYLWEGPVRSKEYGNLKYAGRNQGAHRVAWQLANGPIPEGLLVLHRCDTPLCLNPKHHFLGTNTDNMRDMVAKGRSKHPHTPGERNGRALLSEDDVRAIRALYKTRNVTLLELGERYGVHLATIHLIVSGKSWTHVVDVESQQAA